MNENNEYVSFGSLIAEVLVGNPDLTYTEAEATLARAFFNISDQETVMRVKLAYEKYNTKD
jgi:hypothetical protein